MIVIDLWRISGWGGEEKERLYYNRVSASPSSTNSQRVINPHPFSPNHNKNHILTAMSQFDDGFLKEIQGFSFVVTPTQTQSTNYYNDYCRLYLANVVLTSQMKQIIRETKQLEERIYGLEERQYEYEESESVDKSKRHRRTAGEVSRFHKCTVENCSKSYGSEGSLNQHMKIKHPELVREEEESGESSKVQKENVSHNTQKKPKGKKGLNA